MAGYLLRPLLQAAGWARADWMRVAFRQSGRSRQKSVTFSFPSEFAPSKRATLSLTTHGPSILRLIRLFCVFLCGGSMRTRRRLGN